MAFYLFLEMIYPTIQLSTVTIISLAARNHFVKLTQSRLLLTLFGQPSTSLTTNLKASPTLPNSKKMQDRQKGQVAVACRQHCISSSVSSRVLLLGASMLAALSFSLVEKASFVLPKTSSLTSVWAFALCNMQVKQ